MPEKSENSIFFPGPTKNLLDSITLPPKIYPNYHYWEFCKGHLTFLLSEIYTLLKFWMDLLMSRICKLL